VLKQFDRDAMESKEVGQGGRKGGGEEGRRRSREKSWRLEQAGQ